MRVQFAFPFVFYGAWQIDTQLLIMGTELHMIMHKIFQLIGA